MSLRDQLVAKGLVSKKRARKVERELKAEQRAAKGSRKKKKALAREAEAQRQAEVEAAQAARVKARKAREAARDDVERRLQVQNLLLGNRRPLGRGQRFWHRTAAGGHTLVELQVSSGTAWSLRAGELALAWLVRHGHGEVVAIPKAAAEKLQALDPERLLFFVRDASGISAPDLGLHARTWDPDLRARRATAADLERLKTAS